MAQYNVTHSCGHSEAHYLLGAKAEQDHKAELLADTLCAACTEAAREKIRKAEQAEASEGTDAKGH